MFKPNLSDIIRMGMGKSPIKKTQIYKKPPKNKLSGFSLQKEYFHLLKTVY